MTIPKGQTYREVGAQSNGSAGMQIARLPKVNPSAFLLVRSETSLLANTVNKPLRIMNLTGR